MLGSSTFAMVVTVDCNRGGAPAREKRKVKPAPTTTAMVVLPRGVHRYGKTAVRITCRPNYFLANWWGCLCTEDQQTMRRIVGFRNHYSCFRRWTSIDGPSGYERDRAVFTKGRRVLG